MSLDTISYRISCDLFQFCKKPGFEGRDIVVYVREDDLSLVEALLSFVSMRYVGLNTEFEYSSS